MNWIFLTFVSAMVEAISNVFDRFILKNEAKNSAILLIFWGFFAVFIFCPPALLTGQVSFDLTPIIGGFIIAGIFLLGYYFYYKAVQKEEVDRIIPILALNPIILLVFATIFFHEIHAPIVYFGIFLIILGVLLNAIKFKKYAKNHTQINKKAVLFCAIASTAFAFKNIIGKYLALADFQPLNIIFWIGLNCGIITILIILFQRKNFYFQKGQSIADHALAAALGVAASLLYTVAILIGPAALVGFLSRVDMVFVLVISEIIYFFNPHLLRTRFNKKTFFQKLLGIILILIGCYFLI